MASSSDFAINSRVTGMRELGIKLTKLQGVPRLVAVGLVAKWAFRLQALARRLVRVDTNVTRSSILTELMQKGLTAVVGSAQKAALWLEMGTRPHWPPRGALAGWAKRHGMPASADFLIRRAIAKKGTKARPFLVPAFKEIGPQYVAETSSEVRRALVAVARS